MKTVEEHYAEHLAPIYLWMVGGAEAAFAAGESELAELNLPVRAGDSVLDLGAGFGMHAIPLARRGAQVTAVDSSAELLDSLRNFGAGLPIEAVQSDLLNYVQGAVRPYAAVLCMGDTLTHLRSIDEVKTLFLAVKGLLTSGGTFVLSFRDYSTALEGDSRFIPVRADDRRIHTCFLEFNASSVGVHDLLHEASPQGWTSRVSSYNKLRLSPDQLHASLIEDGFSVRREAGLRGMVRLVAVKH